MIYKKQILAVFQENFKNNAKEELESLGYKDIILYDDNFFIFETDNDFINVSNEINNNTIFIRYISTINFEFELNEIFNFISFLDKDKTYSIQLKCIDNNDFNKTDYVSRIKCNLVDFCENKKFPEQVISIFVFKNKILAGVSETKYNLSRWIFGECRYNVGDLISRSEMKLIEVLDCYNINFENYTTAIDLGCSPGGWSKILLNKNLNVIGIDPAEVDHRLLEYKNFTHFRGLSEDFIKYNQNKKFDIIVNDMKMNFDKSIEIVKVMYDNLNNNGLIIMTIKLFENQKDIIFNILKILENFNIVFKRQLYHNRSEFTIIIKK